MSLFKPLRGDSSRISMEATPFHDGWAYFTPDDGGFYIDATTGSGDKRIRINPPSMNLEVSSAQPANQNTNDIWYKTL